jgi:methionyl aminopeptidase
MKITYKTRDEIQLLREANLVVSAILDELCDAVAPGVSTYDLDQIAVAAIARHGVKSAFLGYYDYPAALCTSVNEVIVHGIPSKDVVLREGDIVGLDFGVFKDGYCGDSARTVAVGTISPSQQKLLDVTSESLDLAIEQCVVGNRLGDISAAIQGHAEKHGFSPVQHFSGHGIGRAMHEEPMVPNFGKAGSGPRLKSGLVIAIEPMINVGTHEIEIRDDQWTAATMDGSLSAHFEHSIAITDDGPWVLSRETSQ